MKKTIAQLRRDAQNGLTLELEYRFGAPIPAPLQGERKAVKVNSVGIMLKNSEGETSELRLGKAALIEYTDTSLSVFAAGLRELTDQERRIRDEWKRITETEEHRAQLMADCLGGGTSTYWKEKAYFNKAGADYLMGTVEQRGMKYDYRTQKIRDESVRGDLILKYKIVDA